MTWFKTVLLASILAFAIVIVNTPICISDESAMGSTQITETDDSDVYTTDTVPAGDEEYYDEEGEAGSRVGDEEMTTNESDSVDYMEDSESESEM